MGGKLGFLCGLILVGRLAAQTAVDIPPSEQKKEAEHQVRKAQEKKAQRATTIEFRGQRAFSEKQLRSQLKEQISDLDKYGLGAAQADDLAFFLELFYRKQGYSKVSVHYVIQPGGRLRLDIAEGPLMALGDVKFVGNIKEPSSKLYEYVVGPTRERYSRLQRKIPFVASDIREGADLVRRFYVAEGFLEATVDAPVTVVHEDRNMVDVTLTVHENRQYFFGDVSFAGQTIYDASTLRGQVIDLLKRPYTEARVDDIRRRLQAYFKARGYYDAKVVATGAPETAKKNGNVAVEITIAPGPIYRFGDVSVTGLARLRESYITKRFTRLNGQVYSPDLLDERFRTLMKSGLFNVLQINPAPVGNNVLNLNISAEEAKSKQFGFSVGYGTYPGAIVGAQYRDGNLFGYGRPLTTSVEWSQRGYKGEITWEDPYFLDSDFAFKFRVAALTFDFDGYSKFEAGGQTEFTRKIFKQDEAGFVFSLRHVDVTSADIKDRYLGPTSYFVNTIGLTNTFDVRESPQVRPRGLLVNNTFDAALSALGSDIEFVRTTMRVGYYIPFAPRPIVPDASGVADTNPNSFKEWFSQSSLAFGARGGVIHSLTNTGSDESTELPIDERFFNGGSSSVRSFGERDLGPHDRKGHPIGGEFFTVFNVEYIFPILGELQGAAFADMGNLLPSSEEPGLDDMRYGVGLGLRYKLPIGPVRIDYGINPDRRSDEDFGAFHLSFGFAF